MTQLRNFLFAMTFALLAACSFTNPPAKQISLHSAMLTAHSSIVRLEFDHPHSMGICSGTIVGTDLILTTKHCFTDEPGPPYVVRVNSQTTKILSLVSFGNEDEVLAVTGMHFPPSDVAVIKPSANFDDPSPIYFWGNANGLYNIFRHGFIGGRLSPTANIYLLDANGWKGDSGAGVFNSEGQLIGTINVIFSNDSGQFHMMGMIPIYFDQKAIAQAMVAAAPSKS